MTHKKKEIPCLKNVYVYYLRNVRRKKQEKCLPSISFFKKEFTLFTKSVTFERDSSVEACLMNL